MSNILTAQVMIKGTRPLLWRRFGPWALPLVKQERSGVPGNDPTEWRKTVLYDQESGQLYLEAAYIFSCLRDGARYTKRGRGSIQKMVAATLQVADEFVWVDRFIPGYNGDLPDVMPTDPNLPVYLDIRGVRNPTTKARNVRYRVAASAGWQSTFNILWDKTVIDRNQMQAVAIDAGRLVGLGDGRSIGLGRFTIETFEINDHAQVSTTA